LRRNLASFYAGVLILCAKVLIVILPIRNLFFRSRGYYGIYLHDVFLVFLPDNRFTGLCRLPCLFRTSILRHSFSFVFHYLPWYLWLLNYYLLYSGLFFLMTTCFYVRHFCYAIFHELFEVFRCYLPVSTSCFLFSGRVYRGLVSFPWQ
jgi:hypothetical protein